MARRLLLALVLLALVASACPSGGDGGFFALDPDEPRELELRLELAASLETFDDCGQVLDYFRESASDMGAERFLWGAVAGGDEDVVMVAPLAGGNGGTATLDRGVAAVRESADAVAGGAAAVPGAASGGDSAATVAGQAGPGPAYSGTNVQEAGIDEPDVVKTDGHLVVALAQGRLVTVDPSGGGARILGSVEAPEGATELFLHGERAVVLGRSWRQLGPDAGGDDSGGGGDSGGQVLPRSLAIAPAGTALTTVSAVDLSDPAAPAVTRTVTFEGDYVTARLHEGVVRLVLRSTPTFEPLPLPTEPGGGPGSTEPGIEPGVEPGIEPGIEPGVEPDIEPGRIFPGGDEPGIEPGGIFPGGDDVRIMANRAVAESTLETWLPDQVVESPQGEQSTEELVACDAVARPPEPSGVGTVTVLTIDAAGSLDPLDTDSVVADAQTVYASGETLYVATNQWLEPTDADRTAGALTTEIHAFDIAAPDRTEYLASGRVRGQLLNQWSLSEHAGHLRVATTDASPGGIDDGQSSESFLTVLRREGGGLDTVGQVGGMGRGERIYAVRYFGDLGFVVTFRQIDPLYALDLSDPADPRVAGELKIPGFSSYLHPVATGRLLGVGQDASDEGRTLGTQVSLFDVADVEHLSRLDHEVVPNAHSPVEHDHRAFLWWGASGLAVLPLEVWQHDVVQPGAEGSPSPSEPFLGAAAFRIEGDRVEPAGRVTHAGRVEPQGSQVDPLRGQGAPPSPGVTEEVPVDRGDALTDDIAAAEYVMPPTITRAFVVGDTLYTLSEAGILASDLATMDDRGWAAF